MNRNKRRQKQMDRILINGVQAIFFSFGIMMLPKVLYRICTSPFTLTTFLSLASFVFCWFGFYRARTLVREAKEWEKWMYKIQVFSKRVAIFSKRVVNEISTFLAFVQGKVKQANIRK